MTIAFVLGNGLSRQGVPLNDLRQFGKIYGCNALYRDYTPDVLVSTDKPISTFIQESGYALTNAFYTRKPLPQYGAHAVPKQYFGFSSGPIATGLAAIDGHTRIYMIGFDMGPTASKTINNIYSGTDFYKPKNSYPTFTGNWIKQVKRIAEDYPTVNFVRVTGTLTADISEFKNTKNIINLPLSTFMDRINNQKDL